MKKRIFAFLLALIMVFSMLALASCDKKSSDDDDEDEEENEEKEAAPLNTQELFFASMFNTVSDGNFDTLSSFSKISDLKGNVRFEFNKLKYQGEDFLDGNKASVDLDIAVDLDEKRAQLKADASIFGEKPSASFIIDTESFYMVDLLGLNNKAIKVTWEEMGVDVDEFLSQSGLVQDEMDKLTNMGEFVIETITKAFENNFSEDKFQKETKTVTVDGKEFSGATVLTLVVDSEIMKSFVDEVLTEFLANETFMEMMDGEQLDKEEVLEALNDFGSITIVNTVVDNKTIALDINIKALADDAEVEDYDEDGVAVATRNGLQAAVKCSFVGGNFKIHFGPTDENGEFDLEQGTLKIEYTVEDGDELLEVFMENPNGKEVFLTAEGTYENGKHEGTLTANAEGSELSFDYMLKGDLMNGGFAISNFKMQSQGETQELPFEIAIDYNIGTKKTSYSVAVKGDVEGVEFDVKMSVSCEYTDVSISVPSSVMSIEDITEDTLYDWMEELQDKFPKIIEFIEEASQNSNGPSDENNYGDGYYDDYYGDDYYDDYYGDDYYDDYDDYYNGYDAPGVGNGAYGGGFASGF